MCGELLAFRKFNTRRNFSRVETLPVRNAEQRHIAADDAGQRRVCGRPEAWCMLVTRGGSKHASNTFLRSHNATFFVVVAAVVF